jgi:hypothetical protein
MKKIFYLLFLIICLSVEIFAQNINLPFGHQSYHWMDRLEIKSGKLADFHTSHKQYSRADIAKYALKAFEEMDAGDLEDGDFEDFKFIYRDNNQALDSTPFLSASHPKYETRVKPFLKHFYKTPANFFEIAKKDFSVIIQPSFSTDLGREITESNNSPYLQKTQGLTVQGTIDDKVSFYTDMNLYYDRYQAHVRRYINQHRSIPGLGFYGDGDVLAGIDSLYDAINAQGAISVNATKHIKVELGHGTNFIGNGYRSLVLSNYAQNYLYLKTNTRVWKMDYQTIFAEMRQLSTSQTPTGVLPRKYLASHHLSMNLGKNFNVGIFESVIIKREDSGFDLNYVNPIIFYRSVERNLGSPDNMLIGGDFKWNFANKFSFYGQAILDELQARNLISNPDSWAHKFAAQLGLKYIDAFYIDHLDIQLEVNVVRPYTYSHFDPSTTYTHFSQPLAHPLGANFSEFLAIVKYQPSEKLFFEMRTMLAKTGKDTLNSNWGGNIFDNYSTRTADDDVHIGQGVATNIFLFNFTASYALFHNCFVELNVMYRTEDSAIDAYDYNSLFFSTGFRLNFWKPRFDF